MPLILAKPNDQGGKDILIVLGPENVERIQEKDPFQVDCASMPGFPFWAGIIQIGYVTEAEMVQCTQLARQGKLQDAIKLVTSGWRYRPELGDHDLPPEQFK